MKTYSISITVTCASECEANKVKSELANAVQDAADSGEFQAGTDVAVHDPVQLP